ncbi:MAG: cyclic nucleotide-binding domain-containing protein [Nitrosomonadales bacterium]
MNTLMTASNPKILSTILEPFGANEISMEEIRNTLDATQMFKDFEWAQIQALSEYIQLYRAVPGTVLFSEGDKGDFMCVVLQGCLDIRKQDMQHDDKMVATVYAGRSLGEMALVDGEVRSATAVVKVPSVLAVLTYDSFTEITRDKPALAVKLLLKIAQLISQRLRLTSGILVDYLEK